jgi:hypothetical protein
MRLSFNVFTFQTFYAVLPSFFYFHRIYAFSLYSFCCSITYVLLQPKRRATKQISGRVRFCKHWSLLVRAWFDFARFSGAESGSRVDSTDSPECVVVADGAPPESGLASSLAGLHRVVSPRGGVAEELSVRELRDSRES